MIFGRGYRPNPYADIGGCGAPLLNGELLKTISVGALWIIGLLVIAALAYGVLGLVGQVVAGILIAIAIVDLVRGG